MVLYLVFGSLEIDLFSHCVLGCVVFCVDQNVINIMKQSNNYSREISFLGVNKSPYFFLDQKLSCCSCKKDQFYLNRMAFPVDEQDLSCKSPDGVIDFRWRVHLVMNFLGSTHTLQTLFAKTLS